MGAGDTGREMGTRTTPGLQRFRAARRTHAHVSPEFAQPGCLVIITYISQMGKTRLRANPTRRLPDSIQIRTQARFSGFEYVF